MQTTNEPAAGRDEQAPPPSPRLHLIGSRPLPPPVSQ